MKKLGLGLTALILLIPALSYGDVVTFKAGLFFPRANSDLWKIEFENMDFEKSHFQDSSFGFSYEYFLSKELSLMLSIDGYTKQKAGTYKLYVGDRIGGEDYAFDYGQGFAISHIFSVSVTPIQGSLKLTPLGRRLKVIPFIGGGAGLYLWNIRLQGDMIDFSEEVEFYDTSLDEYVIGYPIYTADAREENKFKIGFHALAGLMIPVASRISLEAEFKYNFLKGSISDAFEGFEPFDLSSFQFSIGLNYWF